MAYIYSVFIFIFTISTAILLRAVLSGKKNQEYIFKPLSMVLVIIISFLSFTNSRYDGAYSALITAGLLFSLVGDVVLMFESEKNFMTGLVFFIFAQFAYALGFSIHAGLYLVDAVSGAVLVIFGVIFLRNARSCPASMKIPVAVYLTVVSVMVNRALSTNAGGFFSSTQAFFISAGAILFYISDLMLGINRFVKTFRYHRLNLACYFAGQLLIALSTVRF